MGKRGWASPLPIAPLPAPAAGGCHWQVAPPARGKVLISHRWSEVEEIQSAAEADRLSPCYSHGNAQLRSPCSICLGTSASQFPAGNGEVIRGLSLQPMNLPELTKSLPLSLSGTH